MGIAPTKERVRFLSAWQRCEGGRAAFNPLNTTAKTPLSSRYNSAGVQNFPDAHAGIAAHLLTIRLGYYDRLRKALATPNLTAEQILKRSTHDVKTWGTDPSCIARTLGASTR